MSGDAPAAAVWFLTIALAPGQFVDDGPFTVEECTRCGEAWLQAFTDHAKRAKRRPPSGYLCMQAVDREGLELARTLPRRCDLGESLISGLAAQRDRRAAIEEVPSGRKSSVGSGRRPIR